MLNHSSPFEPASTEHAPTKSRPGLLHRIVDEVVQFVFIATYLWAMFGLFALHEAILAKEHGIDFHFYGFGIINSLILGKIVLIAENLNFANRSKNGRLVCIIACKAISFAVLLIVSDLAEEIIVGVAKGKGLSASIPSIGGGGLRGVVLVWIILTVGLLPFFAFREIDAALGGRKLRTMLFAKRRRSRRAFPGKLDDERRSRRGALDDGAARSQPFCDRWASWRAQQPISGSTGL